MSGREFVRCLERRWGAHKKWILVLLAVVLALIAAQRLTSGFRELVLKPGGAIDLHVRYVDVHRWFAGESLAKKPDAVYPPASLAELWPFVGWESFPLARWLWAVTAVMVLAWLAWFAAKESGAHGPWEWAVVALLPLAVYTARAVLVNGQLMLHLLPPLIGGVILLDRRPCSWKRDLGAAGLFLLGLMKPTVALPFLLFVVVAKRPVRLIALIAGGYAALTLFAAHFQPESVWTLMLQWYGRASRDVAVKAAESHANLHSWLAGLGLQQLNLPLSLSILALFAIVLYAYRRSDVWLRLGMAAVVARVWSHHYRYDDMLLIIPLVALIRLVTRRGSEAEAEGRGPAVLVMLLLAFTIMAPARLIFLPKPWSAIYESAQTVIWLSAFAYLLYRARRDHLAAVRSTA